MSRTDNAIRDQAYQFFEQEAIELLQVLEDGLLTLRTQFAMPQVHQLMRAAHSIKGGAASVGLPGIQKIAHRLEDVLRALYRREDPIDADLEGALLQAYDCLRRPLQAQVETGHFDEESAWEQAEPVFSFLETVLAKDLGADIELPSAAELGIDIVSEVFTGDVQRSIEHLESLLQTQTVQAFAGELRASAEVLAGIGELLGLPGFTAIALTVSQALNANPHLAIQIGERAIDSLREAQGLVLAGDRAQGGSPSTALVELTQPHSTPDTSPEPLSDFRLNSSESELALQQDPIHFDIDPTALDALDDLFGPSDPVSETGNLDLEAAYGELEAFLGSADSAFDQTHDETDTSHWQVVSE
ncbi:MAG: Hpt domain-containing protein, partial [Thermosynechococcaceae cyanobacterium]